MCAHDIEMNIKMEISTEFKDNERVIHRICFENDTIKGIESAALHFRQ